MNQKKKFFQLLRDVRGVIYDWGYDTLQVPVSKGRGESDKIFGEQFLRATRTTGISAADVVYILAANNIDVRIKGIDNHLTLGNPEEFREWSEELLKELRKDPLVSEPIGKIC